MGRAGRRLYERPDPDVAEGNALAAQNDPEGALKAYDRALERMPDSPELHFNRANQMLKLGSDHAMRAHDESLMAMNTPDTKLKSRAAFDLGLSYEEMGQPDEAIKAYEQTLALNPDDPDAKVNLELLLKTQEERKKSMPQQQQQESKEQNQQQNQEQQKSNGQDQQKKDQKQADDKKEQQQQNQQEQQQQAKMQDKKEQVAQEEKPVDRSEAERLLDALRASEKNLQAWRFSKEKRKEARHGDAEKDW
jgi:tetratricopeptide (TPR) repeat protein